MSPSRFRLSLAAATALFLALPLARTSAQELQVQPTPFSVWLDLEISALGQQQALPIWMESLQRSFTAATETSPAHTIFRIRLRRMESLNSELQLRLFFKDIAEKLPTITGWTETGVKRYSAPPLGQGLDLPSSENLLIPVAGLDYLEIEVPGNGANVRGAFLTTLRKYEARQALDFEPATSAPSDPFYAPARPQASKDDVYLYGRTRATLEAGTIRLSPKDAPRSVLEFSLEKAPLMALITFEVLGVDPAYPPEIYVNDRPFGRVALQLPDLADPAFQGSVRSLEPDMHFRYTGWIRCQQMVPGSALLSGINKLVVDLARNSPALAIRAVEIELKHHWKHLDYELAP